MKPTTDDIYHMFHGRLIGTEYMKKKVCEAVVVMPQSVIAYVTLHCWFLSSMNDAWAFTFTGSDVKDDHLIFLSDDLLMQDRIQIYYSIAHEIGHVMLGHRNAILKKQSKREIQKQEDEADAFAKKYVAVP